MHVVYIQLIWQFALYYNYYKVSFKTLHYSKRVLDTEMNGYHCFNFTEKLSYQV